MADSAATTSRDPIYTPQKYNVYVTREIALWAEGYGYTYIERSSNRHVIQVTGLRGFGKLMYCLAEGYSVCGAHEKDVEDGIDLTECLWDTGSVKKLEVTDDSYAMCKESAPKPGEVGLLVSIEFTGQQRMMFVKDNIFDVVSPENETRIRIQWQGAHPDIAGKQQFARVL